MTSLIIGIVLIVGGVGFAAAPFFRRRGEPGAPGAVERTDAHEAPVPAATAPRVATATPSSPSAPVLDEAVALALEELELDRAMGKLSADDYRVLRARLQRRPAAVDARAVDATDDDSPAASDGMSPSEGEAEASGESAFDGAELPGAQPPVDARITPAIEAEGDRLVRAMRATVVACPDCGPRPEPAASFCSSCGRALGDCPSCGHAIAQAGARFCDRCGTPLTR